MSGDADRNPNDVQDVKLAHLEDKLDSLRADIAKANSTLERLGERMAIVPLMEERIHRTQASVDAAFTLIRKVEERVDANKTAQEVRNAKVDKTLYLATGFVLALSVIWGLVGTYVGNSVSEVLKLLATQHTQESVK